MEKGLKNSIHLHWFALSPQLRFLRIVTKKNQFTVKRYNVDKDGLMKSKNTHYLYRNWNFMLFLKALQKDKVTFEDIQPQQCGRMLSQDWIIVFIVKALNLIIFIYCLPQGILKVVSTLENSLKRPQPVIQNPEGLPTDFSPRCQFL